MATRFIFTPESAHFPLSNSASLKRQSTSGRTAIAFPDGSANVTAFWHGVAPENFASNADGSVTLDIKYFMTSVNTGVVVLGSSIESLATGTENATTGSFFGTETSSSINIASGNGAGTLLTTTVSVSSDNMQAGQYFRLKLERKSPNAADTAGGDFNVVSVEFKDGV
jgi:hypothetical protein